MDFQFPNLQNGGDTTMKGYWGISKVDVGKAQSLMF